MNGEGAIGTLSDSTVVLNRVTGGAGGLGGNGGDGQGGGVFNAGPSPLGTPSLTLLRSARRSSTGPTAAPRATAAAPAWARAAASTSRRAGSRPPTC